MLNVDFLNADKVLKKTLDQIEKQFEKDFLNALDKLESKQMSKSDLAQFVSELNFMDELNQLGLNDALSTFFAAYHDEIKQVLDFADVAKVKDNLAVNSEMLNAIHTNDLDYLLGSFSANTNKFKSAMISAIVTGTKRRELVKQLDGIGLTTAQINTAITTGFNDFGRTATAVAYQDIPDQKFLYGEGREIDNPSISLICRTALIKQMEEYPDGVTRAQIDSGVYAHIDFIHGRGFNCSHQFYPATKRNIEWQKRLSENAYAHINSVNYEYIKNNKEKK